MSDETEHPTWAHWSEPAWVEVDGLRTALRRGGAGETLLFLHGAGLTRAWLPLYDELSRTVDVVVPEHPGFGDTPMPDWLTRIEDLVLHYDALIRDLELQDIHLVGHSLGGWIAAYLAIFYPERFRSLSLITPLGMRVPDAPIADPFRLSPEKAGTMLLGEHAAEYSEYFDRGAEIDAMVSGYAEAITFARLLWNPRYDIKLDHRLRRVAIPTQVLTAEDDRFIPAAHAERWTELIPDAQLRVVQGEPERPTGHLLIIQQPERLASMLVEHVAGSAAASRAN